MQQMQLATPPVALNAKTNNVKHNLRLTSFKSK